MGHQAVLAGRAVELLEPALADGGIFVDATIGLGGHAIGVLERCPQAHLVGIDRDADALETARANLSEFEDRIRLVRHDFKNLSAVLERLGIPEARGVLFDLGVSSPQLDQAHRGFSYRDAGPLDMRMDGSQPLTADEVVNRYPERELARVIKRFGEERFSARVARRIVAARPVADTTELAEVVKAAIPAATRRTGGHPARRTFQAIRIEVNGEIDALERALPQAVDRLAVGGRLVVISYHSLEDRIVKRSFADDAGGCTCPPDFPVCICGAQARVRVLTRKPIRPSAEEQKQNPRASAAKLRAIERLDVGGEAA